MLLNRVSAKLATVQQVSTFGPGFGTGLPKREPTLDPLLVTKMLTQSDNMPEAKRATTAGSNMHVSGLIGICERAAVLQRVFHDGQNTYNSVTGFDRIVWRIGRAVEAHIRDNMIRGYGANRVLGRWTCPCGATIFEGTFPADKPICPKCLKERDVYLEMDLIDEEYGVQGHPDCMLIWDDGSIIVVEIKSMNAKEWDALDAPKGDHRFQAGMYRRILQRKGYKVSDKVIIIVATKDYKFKRKESPYKEYHVDATNPQLQAELDLALALAGRVRTSVEQGRLPTRLPQCADPHTSTAKVCSQCVRCFNV